MSRASFARLCAALLGVAVALGGCGGAATHHRVLAAPSPIALSSAFAAGGLIPRTYTCDGPDRSPPLRAAGLPAAATEVVVVMRDPDAPGGDFIHWALAHVTPRHGAISLPRAHPPPGAVLGRNSFGSLGYRGPCPPAGEKHRYVITLFALGAPSGLRPGFPANAIGSLRVLAHGSMTGLYARP